MRKLDENLIKQLKSSYEISNIYDCLTQLVYNSIDSNSTFIRIKVNFFTNDLMVIDNGDGIHRNEMELVGEW